MDTLFNHIKSYVSISDKELSELKHCMKEETYQKNDHLLKANDYAKQVHFIIEGCVRTYIIDYNGNEHNISFSKEDWWFGDLNSFIRNKPASFNIQALESLNVLSLNKDKWDYLLNEIPNFVIYTRLLFRNTMFAHEERILQNLSFTAEQRYKYFIKKHSELLQRISQKQIARYLGVTPEFLSLLRKKIS